MKAYIPRRRYFPTLVPGVYSFNEARCLEWLQRLCFWILDRIGCQHYESPMTVEMIEIDFDRIVDLIMRQRRTAEALSNKKCKYVLLGHKQAYQLGIEINDQTQFAFPAWYRPRVKEPYERFLGLRIVLVPWFDGVLCLKELE